MGNRHWHAARRPGFEWESLLFSESMEMNGGRFESAPFSRFPEPQGASHPPCPGTRYPNESSSPGLESPPWNCSRESSEDHRAAWRERRLGVLGARGASGIAYEARMRDGFYAGRSVLKEHGARGAHPGVHFASGFSRRASNAWNQSCPIGEWHGKYRISTLSRDSSQGYDSARCHRSFPARRGGNRKGRRRCH